MTRVERAESEHGTGAGGCPLVSVVIAAFNAEDYVEQTCRSVIQQTYTALELIVVDDGSTDGTGDIVRALGRSDPRIRLIRQQNRGVAAARNAGIAAASGAFIAPLDADDLWDPTKIERQVRRLQQAGPDAGFAYCWWVPIDASGLVLDGAQRWQIEGNVLEHLVEINFIGNASVPLVRRSCIQEVGGYDVTPWEQGRQGCEDWDLALRIAERHLAVVVPAVLVGYRRRADSMSTDCDTMWRFQSRVISALATRQPSLSPAALRRSAGQTALHLASGAFWSGRYLEACRWGARVRPLTLGVRVVPHIVRMFARRILTPSTPRPVVTAGSPMPDEAHLPEPVIPYHRLYGRRWVRQARRVTMRDGASTPV